MVVLRPGASWPPSVAVVQTEISTACQNPNVVSEPNQVNFACGQSTSQILWVFSLMTSGDNPNFNDAKSGRQGLEPISATQGGAVAWSLNLHHPYNPFNPVDSLAGRGPGHQQHHRRREPDRQQRQADGAAGAGEQPGQLRLKYTGSAAVITRAGLSRTSAPRR